jgi:hypothetical protein
MAAASGAPRVVAPGLIPVIDKWGTAVSEALSTASAQMVAVYRRSHRSVTTIEEDLQ